MDNVTLAMLGYIIVHLWYLTYQLGVIVGKVNRICKEINAKGSISP